MERIIKISSDNAFSERAQPGQFTNKLLDLTIPGRGTFDLSKSYINLHMDIIPGIAAGAAVAGITSDDTALYSNQILLQQDLANTKQVVADCATLVRNCQMESQNRGMVESIRRVDTLRTLLYYLENDVKQTQDSLDTFGTFHGRRGVSNRTGNHIQHVITNVGVDNRVDTEGKSNSLSRDYRINFSDLFGVGNAMWNGDVFGDTRINLELNINKLIVEELGGAENVTAYPSTMVGNTTYGACQNKPSNAAGATLSVLTTVATYKDYGLNFPFWVGQAIAVNANGSAEGGAITEGRVVIESIQYQNNSNTNPPSPTNAEVMIITTRTPYYTNGTGTNSNLTNVTINALISSPGTSQIEIQRAELVLTEMIGVDGPEEIDYRTYATEEQNGVGAINFFNQYAVEPNAQNLIIAHCNANEILPGRAWAEYRLAINNIDQTGNRSVFYRQNLHQDRVLRFMNNRGQTISNMGMYASDCRAQQGDGQQTALTPICETLPLTAGSKTVTLQLAAAGGIQDVILYRELVRSI